LRGAVRVPIAGARNLGTLALLAPIRSSEHL
jgi:hypothetical protein